MPSPSPPVATLPMRSQRAVARAAERDHLVGRRVGLHVDGARRVVLRCLLHGTPPSVVEPGRAFRVGMAPGRYTRSRCRRSWSIVHVAGSRSGSQRTNVTAWRNREPRNRSNRTSQTSAGSTSTQSGARRCPTALPRRDAGERGGGRPANGRPGERDRAAHVDEPAPSYMPRRIEPTPDPAWRYPVATHAAERTRRTRTHRRPSAWRAITPSRPVASRSSSQARAVARSKVCGDSTSGRPGAMRRRFVGATGISKVGRRGVRAPGDGRPARIGRCRSPLRMIRSVTRASRAWSERSRQRAPATGCNRRRTAAKLESVVAHHDQRTTHDAVAARRGRRALAPPRGRTGRTPDAVPRRAATAPGRACAATRSPSQSGSNRQSHAVGDAVDDLAGFGDVGDRDDVARDVDDRLPPLAPHAPTLSAGGLPHIGSMAEMSSADRSRIVGGPRSHPPATAGAALGRSACGYAEATPRPRPARSR